MLARARRQAEGFRHKGSVVGEDGFVPIDLSQLLPTVELTEELHFILDVGIALAFALIAGGIAISSRR